MEIERVLLTPPQGTISLKDKEVPVCELKRYISQPEESPSESLDPPSPPLVCTRAQLDVSELRRKVLGLPEDSWKDEEQSRCNVHLVRPGHDSWGVNKIVFHFCDDFLLKTYDFPFSQDEEWRRLLSPIYAAVGVDEKRIVRSLLARMPPGAKIPVHHDTGYWVRFTHRCHIAIVTDPAVHFYVGPTADRMAEYSFDEGRLVELNNQAKHAVSNESARCFRVHLIFDYMDPDPPDPDPSADLPAPPASSVLSQPRPQRVVLEPGDKLSQTRRTIDIVREAALVRCRSFLPSFLILGAQKSGTTSLYEFICQHPLVLKGKCRETHYLDWRFDRSLSEEDVEGHRRNYGSFFPARELERHPTLVTGESTPSYLLHSDVVIPRVRRLCPWAKLLVMLRDPVRRAYSQYQMFIDCSGSPEQIQMRSLSKYRTMSFEAVVDSEIAELERLQVRADMPLEAFRERYLLKGKGKGDGDGDGKGDGEEALPMNHGGHSVVARGLYVFQLAAWLEAFGEAQVKVLALGDLQQQRGDGDGGSGSGSGGPLLQVLDEVFVFLGLPPVGAAGQLDLTPRNTRRDRYSADLTEAARQKLQRFYEPFNERLFQLLGRRIQDW